MQKLKNNEARPKFTGSYKKKSVYSKFLLFRSKLFMFFANLYKHKELHVLVATDIVSQCKTALKCCWWCFFFLNL